MRWFEFWCLSVVVVVFELSCLYVGFVMVLFGFEFFFVMFSGFWGGRFCLYYEFFRR